jgi:SAM-dependent methyltransferase
MNWEQDYQQAETVWGEKPDLYLLDIAPLVPRGRVLDLGMGEGRNAVYFALRGFDVTGIDSAPTAVQKCLERARTLQISLQAEARDIRALSIEPGSLALVICAMSLQFMKQSESEVLLRKLKAGLQPGGFLYITTFSTEDPMFEVFRQSSSEIERNTFFSERLAGHVHFFNKAEIMALLGDLKLHHFSQAIILDHGHPGVPQPHYHGILTYIGQRALSL